MSGIDALSGSTLDELADIRQSISTIITTPVGSRVMRREFGSHVFGLVDAPGSPVGIMQMIAAMADGITRWEPRVTLKSARVTVELTGETILSTTCAVNDSELTITADTKIGG